MKARDKTISKTIVSVLFKQTKTLRKHHQLTIPRDGSIFGAFQKNIVNVKNLSINMFNAFYLFPKVISKNILSTP